MMSVSKRNFLTRAEAALTLLKTLFVLRGVKKGSKIRVHGRVAIFGRSGVSIGSGTCFHSGRNETELRVFEGARLSIGRDCRINNSCVLNASHSLQIGDRCLLGYGVLIFDSHLHEEAPQLRHERPKPQAVVIEDDVWIGSRAVILAGVTIGHGSIIAAGSLVNKDVPPMTIVGGNPARVLRPVRTQKLQDDIKLVSSILN